MGKEDVYKHHKIYCGMDFFDVKMASIDRDVLVPFAMALMKEIEEYPSNINLISDYTNFKTDVDFMNAIKKRGKEVVHHIDLNIAIGITGFSYILMRIYQAYTGKTFRVFKTREEAMLFLKKKGNA